MCAVQVAPTVVDVIWSREWSELKRLWMGWGSFQGCYLIGMVFPMYQKVYICRNRRKPPLILVPTGKLNCFVE